MACASNNAETCGNGNFLSLYQISSSAPPPSTSLAPISSFNYIGCQTDVVTDRTLDAQSLSGNGMKIEPCNAFCTGYTYLGLEWSQEWYYGNTLLAMSTVATDGRCSMVFTGNPGEICGGVNGLSLYEIVVGQPTSATSTHGIRDFE
jgi:hypothetical protein